MRVIVGPSGLHLPNRGPAGVAWTHRDWLMIGWERARCGGEGWKIYKRHNSATPSSALV